MWWKWVECIQGVMETQRRSGKVSKCSGCDGDTKLIWGGIEYITVQFLLGHNSIYSCTCLCMCDLFCGLHNRTFTDEIIAREKFTHIANSRMIDD